MKLEMQAYNVTYENWKEDTDFYLSCQVDIGLVGEVGSEIYNFNIISPERLGKLIIGDEIELGRGYFITADYNKEKIIRRIENILESIQTNNEDKMFDELEKFFLSRI